MRNVLKQVKLLLLDVDGILTDGRIIYDNQGNECKTFDVKDGHGLKLLQRAGLEVGIITGRKSQAVSRRAKELGIEILYQDIKDKMVPFLEILALRGLRADEVAYMGDDLVDLPLLKRVGFSATVADAVEDIKPFVHHITVRSGGRGAVREVCDLILKESGRWNELTDRYFQVPE